MSDVDILAQLRAWRDEFARSHGYDIHAMAAALRDLDGGSKRKVVHGEPRRPVVTRVPNKSAADVTMNVKLPLADEGTV